jgi:hypothetical protein
MTDDEQLGTLFRAAASDSGAPPPGFDHHSVVAASRRITVRRRAAVTGVGVALFAAVGIGGVLVLPSASSGGAGDTATVAAPMHAPVPDQGSAPEAARGDARAAAPDSARAAAPDSAQAAAPESRGAPPPPAAPNAAAEAVPPGAAAVGGPPLGPGTAECADRQDPALRAIVEQVLPEVVGAPEAATTMECRPGGERGVNVEVADGAAHGLLTVEYLPPGETAPQVEGALTAPTASGGTVLVSSRPERPGEPAPLADRLQDAVDYLAPRL